VCSASAHTRLRHAKAFLEELEPGTEVLVVAGSRGAADDLVRKIALERGATVGLHRFSLAQLAARIAAAPLAARGTSPSSTLGTEAVAARAAFETARAGSLAYFNPVSSFPGFPRALASTLREMRAASVTGATIGGAPRVGPDLAALLENFEAQFTGASAADRAELFRVASEELRQPHAVTGRPLVLIDVPCDSPAEQDFVRALWAISTNVLATIPAGDEPALRTFEALVRVEQLDEEASSDSDLSHLRRHLFRDTQPKPRDPSGDVKWFSAPGEGRECTEIARFILAEARAGVRFDEIAILLRAPQRYQGLLEHALARAGIPAWFDRGTRRPHPAGRAFLALLSCAVEELSAARFAEYLSLGQVPLLENRQADSQSAASRQFSVPTDELLEAIAARAIEDQEENDDRASDPEIDLDEDSTKEDSAVVAGTLRAPWKWERLLVESAVIGGVERWRRRLEGLDQEYRLNATELRAKDPEDPRLNRIERDLANLRRLREFALPLVETLASWASEASWGDWLDRLEALAPRVLRRPDDVVRILADLRPMSEIGPVSLEEVTRVLNDRLLAIEAAVPRSRYGQVFVGSPHQARGRVFRVVFVPGLAERMFPQRLAEDPLLVDEIRQELGSGLPVEGDRAATERLLLRLTVGSPSERLYVSYPRIDASEARERVPSFYALEIVRAVTGELPGPDELRRLAAVATDASLAWPAPKQPQAALDDFEHDLAVLAPLLKETDADAVRGRARYLIQLSDTLRRSVTSRWERWQKKWASSDGIIRITPHMKEALATQRLTARPYSLSALQQFAECPYRFLLSAIHRLEPFESPQPLQRLDPLTKGSLVHRIQAEFFRALQDEGELPLRPDRAGRILHVLDSTVERIAAEFADLLAPAIDRVWRDEIEVIRSDLREWAERVARAGDGWDPEFFEFAFGLAGAGSGQDRRDPRSRPNPVKIDGRFLLRGSVDLVERKHGTRERRVTDHKTGRNRSTAGMVVGGGRVLQPVLYGLAVEEAMGDPVLVGRLSYCTAAGGFSVHDVELTGEHRRAAIEVLEIVDRAVETGFLPAAPNAGACGWCDFHAVCGPHEEKRVSRKQESRLSDLTYLRGKP
jgi:CRISPR/Cas system-associated exonuclease Cas4 (RecB family)